MQGTSRILAVAALLGLGTIVTTGSALAGGSRNGTGGLPTVDNVWGLGYGWGSSTYWPNSPVAEDGGTFRYEYPASAGHDVRAIAVELSRSGFRHRRVAGPGIIYYHGELPRPYRMNQYW
ncbi:hypothetical protein QY049_26785 [Bradyrhizobium sp. WYCCWR 13022]|uniref:hypothetical protein n=1 Tax=unclassified Bradyrhizobium TaxID=2631580 RepID=UPI00263A5BC0|nr:hypothetical protein [Bradyrhizobium sp. WYCCWR 13022]MDN4986772.1 hypothetical protein [Bradyrhizobium sp. WYCCWR 13022]